MRVQPLTCLTLNQNATVVKLKLPDQEQSRLTQLGLRCGVCIKVLQTTGGSPLLVAVGDCRIGLNYQVAQKIYVCA